MKPYAAQALVAVAAAGGIGIALVLQRPDPI